MDSDALVRRGAIAALPLLALAVWFLRADPESSAGSEPAAAGEKAGSADPAASSASPGSAANAKAGAAAAVVDGPRSARPSSGPSVDELAEAARRLDDKRPERAVRKEPESNHPRRDPTTAPRKPTTVSAVDLPVADPAASPGAPASGKSRLPPGPCGGVQVRAITDSNDPEWAFATLAEGPEESAHLRRIGDKVGSWKVVDIEWDRVWLSQGGGRCAVGMHAGVREAQAQVAAAQPDDDQMLGDADEPAPVWQVPASIVSGIERVSVTEYDIQRSTVDAIFDSASDLLSGVVLQPVERGERVVGIQLGKLPVDSLLERLGLQTGDIVLSVGEEPCVTLQDTIGALEAVRDSEQVVLRVERQGQPFQLYLRVV